MNRCSWTCPHCGTQCGGTEMHTGEHQCEFHYRPKDPATCATEFLLSPRSALLNDVDEILKAGIEATGSSETSVGIMIRILKTYQGWLDAGK